MASQFWKLCLVLNEQKYYSADIKIATNKILYK
jgi:hypothetical protein